MLGMYLYPYTTWMGTEGPLYEVSYNNPHSYLVGMAIILGCLTLLALNYVMRNKNVQYNASVVQ